MTAIFDTKTDWTTIQTTSCGSTGNPSTDCPSKTLFNTASSSTYVRSAVQSSLTYGELDFTGYSATDSICFDQAGTCLTNQYFYEAITAENESNQGFLSDVEAIVGLSRNVNTDQNLLVTQKLYSQGKTFQGLFSFNLAPIN